jgi:glycosyltransferase involved in cell wall biosynthesis
LNRSLSVLLPVHNVEPTLADSVEAILEVVGELTTRFELIVIDDGSTDATWEAAKELARGYPQVRLLRELIRRGPGQATRSAMCHAKGDTVIAHDGKPGIDACAIVRLWRSLGRPATKTAEPIDTTSGPGQQGFRLLRPCAIDELRRSVAATQEIAWKELPAATQLDEPVTEIIGPRPFIDPPAAAARGPNFLSRVKQQLRNFTLGE